LNRFYSPEHFFEVTAERLKFLESLGFRRCNQESSPVGASVYYKGDHVCFYWYLDIRDQLASFWIAKVIDGEIADGLHDAGYANDLLYHVIKFDGYRGGVSQDNFDDPDPLVAQIESNKAMLIRLGQKLLADRPDSFPPEARGYRI